MVTEGGSVPRKRDRLSLKLNVKSTETILSEDDGQAPACGEACVTSPPSPIVADTASSHMVAENPGYQPLVKDDSDLLQKTVGIAGLQNLGNTCYLNSVLQVLRFTPGFLHGLTALNSSNPSMPVAVSDAERGTSWALIKQLSLLYSQLEKRETRFERLRQQGSSMSCPSAGRPGALLTVIRKINPMFEGNLQHDAQELLHCILCLLEDSEKELHTAPQSDIKPSPKLCTILDFFGNNGKNKAKAKVSMKREKDVSDSGDNGVVKAARMSLDYSLSSSELEERSDRKTSVTEPSLNCVNRFGDKEPSPVSLASGNEQSSSPTGSSTAIRNIDITPTVNGRSKSRTPTPTSDDVSSRCRSKISDSYHVSPGSTPVSRDQCGFSGLASEKSSNGPSDFALPNRCGVTPDATISNGLGKSQQTPSPRITSESPEWGLEKGSMSCGVNGNWLMELEQNNGFSNSCKKRKLSPNGGVPVLENNTDRVSPKTDMGAGSNNRGKRLGMRGGVPRTMTQSSTNAHVPGHKTENHCETTSAQLYRGINGTDISISEGTGSKIYKPNTHRDSNSPNTRSSPRKLTPVKFCSSTLGNGPAVLKMSQQENVKSESSLYSAGVPSSPRKGAKVDIKSERVSEEYTGKEEIASETSCDGTDPRNESRVNNLSSHCTSSEERTGAHSSGKTTVAGRTTHSLKNVPFTENDLKNAALNGIKQAHVKLEKCDRVFDSPLNAVNVGVALKHLKTPMSVQKGFIERLFQGTMMLRTKCLECEFARERLEVFHDVSVPVRKTDTSLIENGTDSEMEQGLRIVPHCEQRNKVVKGDSDSDEQGSLNHLMSAFSEVELLEKDNKYFCDNCTRYVEAERSMHYDTLPDVLTLHLKRFSSCAGLFGRVSKINDHVPTPFILPCLRYKCPNPCFRRDHRYQLYAVITHAGLTISSGHYMAFVRVISPGPAMYALQQWARKQIGVDELSSDADSEKEVFFKQESESSTDAHAALTPDQIHTTVDESHESIKNETDTFCVPSFAGDATAQSMNKENVKKLNTNAEVLPSDFSNYWLEFDDDYVGVLSHTDFMEKLARNSGFHATPYVLFYHRYDD